MPQYRMTLQCGHTRIDERDDAPTSKAPKCPDCPKRGTTKVNRPLVKLEQLVGKDWKDLPLPEGVTVKTPRAKGTTKKAASGASGAARVAFHSAAMNEAKGKKKDPEMATPILDRFNELHAANTLAKGALEACREFGIEVPGYTEGVKPVIGSAPTPAEETAQKERATKRAAKKAAPKPPTATKPKEVTPIPKKAAKPKVAATA